VLSMARRIQASPTDKEATDIGTNIVLVLWQLGRAAIRLRTTVPCAVPIPTNLLASQPAARVRPWRFSFETGRPPLLCEHCRQHTDDLVDRRGRLRTYRYGTAGNRRLGRSFDPAPEARECD